MSVIPKNFIDIIKYQLVIVAGILIAIICFFVYDLFILFGYYCNSGQQIVIREKSENQSIPLLQTMYQRRIDGVVAKESLINLYPVAVMIDNHPDSRPNYGLSDASLVYETLVEGGTTRFLAIYTPSLDDNSSASKIGPVRSVRPYFVHIAKEYDALLAHSGGSPQALQEIKKLNIKDLEEIAWWGPDYFWRVYSRPSPHNLFPSETNLAQAITDWELADIAPDYQAWKFEQSASPAISINNVNDIYVDFSLGTDYDASYIYNTSTDSYFRFQSGSAHVDALTNQPIAVKNVIVQSVPTKNILDETGRISLDLYGIGDAIIYSHGSQTNGSWQRQYLDSRTVFYNGNGQEIIFTPGNIWIEILPE